MTDRNQEIVLRKKLNITDLAGEKVMVDFELGKYFMIRGTGNDIWEMIQNSDRITPAQITDRLLQEYDVTEEECERSVMEFLERLQNLGFID